ncbi:MAG TPA: prenyltransferase/squalene oxidase repeat-containing protein [Anaerolineae bacterium]|nr:prenyltransferase/squalene oxidase repeat-containing protein [Anaerolineae bacterium]
MNLRDEVHDLLRKIGPGQMMTTAYDTAWVARLIELGDPLGHRALDWLREHQLEDGSWGAEYPIYHHDRVICTLAAMNALARRNRPADRPRLRRAESALEYHISRLNLDPAGETIGFEMIVPTLLREAKTLGALHRDELAVINALAPRRAAKLAVLPKKMISRYVTVAFSAEMAGMDGLDLLDVDHLQESDGSISYSPSATAFYALHVRPNDPVALEYLRRVAPDGKAPNVAPFDMFEQAWSLWNLSLTGELDAETLQLCQSHLDFLQNAWIPGRGAGFAANYESKDSDVTSLVYEVLSRFGRQVDFAAILGYEEPYYFRCYALESNPSVSANIHVLASLRQAGLELTHPAIQKAARFIEVARDTRSFWFDKWHASPYYVTAHAIIACSGYNDTLVQDAVKWLLSTQNPDGSWGYYMPTAEETAYCLQALVVWHKHGIDIPSEVFSRAGAWLQENMDPPYFPLWVGKCLYCPELVVRSTILSALILVNGVLQ